MSALLERGHEVVCFLREQSARSDPALSRAILRFGQPTDRESLLGHGFCGEHFDVVLSCLASRNGEAEDAWKVDHGANSAALSIAKSHGVKHFVLLSAICLQRPKLAFQKAKLAFESELMGSGLKYSIVRPTAFFKSLSGQVERVKSGKSFFLFGSGELTSCKPISDADLAAYLADCIDDPERQNRILPIGGPGEAITPKQQGQMLFDLLGRKPKFTHVPVIMLDMTIGLLGLAGLIFPAARKKAEYARIGRYYATESMLLYDAESGQYDASKTPETGTDTLREHYKMLVFDQAD